MSKKQNTKAASNKRGYESDLIDYNIKQALLKKAQNTKAELAEAVYQGAIREWNYGKPQADIAQGATLGALLAKHKPQAEHSPLPWQLAEYGIKELKAKYLCIKHGKKTIARIDAWDTSLSVTPTDEANARLIVASVNNYPAMLAICKEIADSGCDLGDSERRIRLYSALEKAGEL